MTHLLLDWSCSSDGPPSMEARFTPDGGAWVEVETVSDLFAIHKVELLPVGQARQLWKALLGRGFVQPVVRSPARKAAAV